MIETIIFALIIPVVLVWLLWPRKDDYDTNDHCDYVDDRSKDL